MKKKSQKVAKKSGQLRISVRFNEEEIEDLELIAEWLDAAYHVEMPASTRIKRLIQGAARAARAGTSAKVWLGLK